MGSDHLDSAPGSAQSMAAHQFLASLDDPIAELARAHGPVDFALPSHGVAPPDHLGRLALSIVGQVISARAAIAVFGRLAEQLGGRITAEALAEAREGDLRALGLTAAKARALRELGAALTTGAFTFDALERMTDAEAEERLVAMRGVGPWSAQMFLLRSLRRSDVFPAGDLGLRRGIQLLEALPAVPSIAAATTRALAWQPYRSYAAKYLWLRYAQAGASMDPRRLGNAED